jgi:hypothetical protein
VGANQKESIWSCLLKALFETLVVVRAQFSIPQKDNMKGGFLKERLRKFIEIPIQQENIHIFFLGDLKSTIFLIFFIEICVIS